MKNIKCNLNKTFIFVVTKMVFLTRTVVNRSGQKYENGRDFIKYVEEPIRDSFILLWSVKI